MAPQTRITEFSNHGFTFDVVDSGPIDGTPVVLLHGFPQRASSWEQVSAHLHERGVRTFAPDQRGYSPRARPRGRFGYRISALVSDITAMVDAIDSGPVHLVGHDWGAAVAWASAGSHPESFSSLTAVSVPHPGAFLRSMLSSNQALRSSYMALFQLPFVPERMLGRPGGRGEAILASAGMTPTMIEQFRREIIGAGALPGGLGYYRSMFLSTPGDFRQRVSVPTTYVWSDGDTALGRRGADLCADFVTGPYELQVFEGASHWIPDERPAELAASIAARAGV